MEGRRVGRIETERRQALQHFLVAGLQLDARQMRAQAAMHAGIECNVRLVLAVEVVAVRLRERLRVKIGGRQEQHRALTRSEEHTSELQSLMRISYAVFCLKKKNNKQ